MMVVYFIPPKVVFPPPRKTMLCFSQSVRVLSLSPNEWKKREKLKECACVSAIKESEEERDDIVVDRKMLGASECRTVTNKTRAWFVFRSTLTLICLPHKHSKLMRLLFFPAPVG